MSTSGSGELFKLRLKRGIHFDFQIDNYTVISTSDAQGTITNDFFPNNDDKIMTITEVGNGFSDTRMKIPVCNIRYIQCINDNVA
jgi:hypothetical protein